MAQRRTPTERLAELEAKKSKADARLAALKARLKDRQHRDDIRRKLILAELVLAEADADDSVADYIRDLIRRKVTNPVQLVLFSEILKGGTA